MPEKAARPTFIADIEAIRERARRQIGDGAVTPSYGADRNAVMAMLNEALATEIVCVPRYRLSGDRG
jgi:bacterioferritin